MIPSNPDALSSYLGQERGEIWVRDLRRILKGQYSKFKKELIRIKEARNTHIAHSQFAAPKNDLPSVAAFEDLLGLAFRFHAFINAAFLNSHPHPILTDTQVQASLVHVLREIGLPDVTTTWPN